jgi:hypothetical protein
MYGSMIAMAGEHSGAGEALSSGGRTGCQNAPTA